MLDVTLLVDALLEDELEAMLLVAEPLEDKLDEVLPVTLLLVAALLEDELDVVLLVTELLEFLLSFWGVPWVEELFFVALDCSFWDSPLFSSFCE